MNVVLFALTAMISTAAGGLFALRFRDHMHLILGFTAGVLLGGVLTEYAGWEWVLWVNVPIGLIAAFLAPRLLDESMRESETRHFDALGAIVVTAGLSLLVFSLVDTVRQGWGSTQTIVLLAISLLIAGSRMYVAAHYLSDVVVAAVLGIFCAWLCARLVVPNE